MEDVIIAEEPRVGIPVLILRGLVTAGRIVFCSLLGLLVISSTLLLFIPIGIYCQIRRK